MKKLLLLLLLYVIPVKSQPVVPNFTTGTLSSTTNTTTSISETITSTDYFGNSYEYTVTGLGVTTDGSVAPNTTNVKGHKWGESDMDRIRFIDRQQTSIYLADQTLKRISIYRDLSWPRWVSNVTNSKKYRVNKRSHKYLSVLSIILLSPAQVLANAVSQSIMEGNQYGHTISDRK